MSTNVEIYRAWEKAPPATVCHVLIIDPVGGDASDRITLTDKPYYDFGTGGAKYHDTYAAPIQCIISDLETDETREATRFPGIKVSGISGRLAGLASRTDMRGAAFSVLRGDTSWSLLSTDFPYKFIEIYKGTITEVLIDSQGPVYSIQFGNVAANLTRKIGTLDAPVSFGSVFNVPVILVDSATDRHRVDTRPLDSENPPSFILRDGGAQLNQGFALDFVDVVENSEFRGLIELNGGPPSRDLTATIERSQSKLQTVISQIIQEYVFDNTPVPTADVSPFNVSEAYCFNADESILFTVSSVSSTTYVRAYPLGTPGVLATLPGAVGSYSEQLSIEAYVPSLAQCIRLSSDGTKLYVLASEVIHQWDLAAADTLTGATYHAGESLGPLETFLSADVTSFDVSSDGSHFFFLNILGGLYQLDATGGDVDTLANSQVALYTKSAGWGEADFVSSFHFSPDESRAYVYRQNYQRLYQYNLPDPGSFVGAYFSGRSVFLYADDENIIDANERTESIIVSITGNKFYRRPGGPIFPDRLFVMDEISDFDLPYESFTANRPEGFFHNPLLFRSGAFFNNETSAQEALTFLVSSAYTGFSINRFGSIQSVLLTYPGTYPDALTPDVNVYAIGAGDFLGEGGSQIRHVATEKAHRVINVRWRKNYRPQGRTELAGIAEDDFDLYGRPYSLNEFSGPSDDGDEVVIDSAFYDEAEATFFGWVLEDWPQSYIFEVTVKLSAVTLLSDFGLGSIVSLDTRYISDYPTFGQALVIGRKVNWSKNRQTLLLLSNNT